MNELLTAQLSLAFRPLMPKAQELFKGWPSGHLKYNFLLPPNYEQKGNDMLTAHDGTSTGHRKSSTLSAVDKVY